MTIQTRDHRHANNGGIYVADGATLQAIAAGATYAKLTGFASDGGSYGAVVTDVANDQIKVTRPGIYLVQFAVSYTLGTNNVICRFAVFQDGAELAYVHGATKTGTGTDMQSTSGVGRAAVSSTIPGVFDLRMRHSDGSSVDFTPVYMNFVVQYVGDA